MLVKGGTGDNFTSLFFKLILRIDILSTYCEFALRWVPENIFADKSALAHVMAWCRQATSHQLNHCWTRFISPYLATMSLHILATLY